uniref:MHD2 domain-containing protein n=1 Tax=Lactuca sativa TaxID=4236 RepID=A0A9R1XVI4_LACSA|nr:hypothetical protein LSAT_V11C100019350 [Lactuca sativa]
MLVSPGSINNINVLNRSPTSNNIYDGSAPDSSFQVRGTPSKYGYYLVDGIYPEYAVFVKSFTCPHGSRQKKFKKAQERARKDVERAFGALKKRCILKKPATYIGEEKLPEIMYTCLILHNMIIEDEGRTICEFDEEETIPETQPIEIGGEEYMNRRAEIRCTEPFHNLRNDLVEHIYGVQNINLNLDPSDDPEDDYLNVMCMGRECGFGGTTPSSLREMPPFEAETAITNLVKGWTKLRLDKLKEIIDETLDAFFNLPIPMHPTFLPHLVLGIDRCLQYYSTKVKSNCESRNTYIPALPALTRCTTEKKFHELETFEKRIITLLRNSESAHVSDFSNRLKRKFKLTPPACLEGTQKLCESTAYKIVFHDLQNLLWDNLYVGGPTCSPIEPFLQELEKNLTVIADNGLNAVSCGSNERKFRRVVVALLGGGPTRCFTIQDSRGIEDDFKAIKDLFFANGYGLSMDVINKFSIVVRDVILVFGMETEAVVERFRRLTLEVYMSSAKSSLLLPATTVQWCSNDLNTLLHVLCYRNDDSALKFLKKTYNLPKKI